MDNILSEEGLRNQLLRLLDNNNNKRILVGIAGAPASGKSTLSESLVESINSHLNKNIAATVQQDGFHYDDTVLKTMGRLSSKGAPDTFDVAGLIATLKRLKVEGEVAVPVFDRELEISRNCAKIISTENQLIIVEGNYLLLKDQSAWKQLKSLFDLTISLSVSFSELEKRLIQRWLDNGYDLKKAKIKAQQNDLINADLVTKQSSTSDFVIQF